jgi:ketosteroid isomerase-like protein
MRSPIIKFYMIIPLPGSFMKRIALAVSLVALVFAVSGFAQTAARPKGGSVEQEIIKLEKEWMDAWLKQDAAFIDRILADDYTSTDADGAVFTKMENLNHEPYKPGEFLMLSTTFDEIEVHVYGDAAVYMARGNVLAEREPNRYRWTDMWVKTDGRWQCVASHWSRVAGT